jgi:SAM-dependent methyltransferase
VTAELLAGIERYYTAKVLAHGPTPMGVDWACQPTQELRFVQLLKACDFSQALSLNDIGCGYGALLDFMRRRFSSNSVDYLGVDLSASMIAQALRLHSPSPVTQFAVGHAAQREADYSVASGIFNVKLDQPLAAWTDFVQATLSEMHATSRRAFAVNFMAPLAHGDAGAPQLYRPEPKLWREWCERKLGATATVLANYGMREYTLVVRRAGTAPLTGA